MKRVELKRELSLAVILVTALSMLSCIAAIPLVVKYVKEQNQTKAKAEMPIPAEKVYQTAVSMAEEKGLQLLKKEDEKLYLEVTDGVQTASLKAVSMADGKTEITVVATVASEEAKEKKKEQEQELALRVINRLCERLKEKCTIEQQEQK